ncbi:putative Zn-dependent protease with MMP-like domain [Rhodobacter aestuarii]|uniref:Predicted Zn-dependent protease, minimal metalloprotease (MMP)-like domain n=1 Tax=Rhodobacter aestuarii TaxID=453582 RepID=A0A1N7KWC0_9RHOB|nr:metallopeptidase family protein [Rhodobacter aestuarii]PTV95538.1 putative Zn-dependent protease with MMP-like domain [Rhodobacter aestuarii]SIS65786.1 Predicted Zn-dependent protease, minimal metalloprotease (MMP)-like domain [Rhodobacter aestuarii]
MSRWKDCEAPSLAEIEAMAEAARALLPEAFQASAAQVVLRVEDVAPDTFLEELEIDDPYELTGLYEGVPMTEKSIADPSGPDVIWLFRRAILDEWVARGDVGLNELVAHVFVHEMAHHFGWSDDDIAAIDRWWE